MRPAIVPATALALAITLFGPGPDASAADIATGSGIVVVELTAEESKTVIEAVDSAARDSLSGHISVPLEPIIGPNDWKGFHPSDITVDPVTGNYVIVAAQERALVEITPAGQLVKAQALGKALNHVEGVAITKDRILILSTEGDEKVKGAISLFRWPERR